MKVTIVKPYAPKAETFHVHAEGCRDLKPRRYVMVDAFTINADSEVEVVHDTYPPDDFGYDPTGPDADAYSMDFRFFPCVRFNEEATA